MKHKTFISTLILIAVIALFSPEIKAQCAMCKAVAESNIENKANNIGQGLNTGILYLMTIPYIIIGSIFFFSFKKQILGYIKGFSLHK